MRSETLLLERSLSSAFVNSSNIFFAKAFDQIGTEAVLADLNEMFHFGTDIQCDFGTLENIYENIDYLVDTVFANYLSRPGVRQPILTSYCDGNRVTCNGLSQWGSQYLAEEGYSAIEIIRYYYGNDMYINTAEFVAGVPSSWPGYNLTVGSSGDKVRQLQTQLNRIARNYPALPTITPDGIYGSATADAVRTFQGIFNLPQTGVTDYATWYEISEIYVGVTRIAEPGQ